jgi:uncharacterized phage-like protein YoqJ
MIVAITGHRDIENRTQIYSLLQQAYKDLGVTRVIEGTAPGADLIAGVAAYDLGIPVTSARPYNNHYVAGEYQEIYDLLLQNSDVVIVSDVDNYAGPWVFHKRNQWMVDNAQKIIAIWDGRPNGGTWSTCYYAHKNGKEIYRINPKTGDVGWHTTPIRYSDATFV